MPRRRRQAHDALAFAAQLLTPSDATSRSAPAFRSCSSTRTPGPSGCHQGPQQVPRRGRVRKLKQTSIPVDVVRRFVVEPARLAPQIRTNAPAAKVFVIDEAELMNTAAQNALLKTLEEPPSAR